jgi:hypothetical protein
VAVTCVVVMDRIAWWRPVVLHGLGVWASPQAQKARYESGGVLCPGLRRGVCLVFQKLLLEFICSPILRLHVFGGTSQHPFMSFPRIHTVIMSLL